MPIRRLVLSCLIACGLSACGGGAKLVKHPAPLQLTKALATASDQHVAATLDWVIVRNGVGAWARNADWDEYLIRVHSMTAESARVTDVVVIDSLGNRIALRDDRSELVSGSKETVRRYRLSGLKIKAGMGGAGLVATGAAVTALGVGAAYGSAASSLMGGGAAAGGAAAASALVLAGPAFVIVGIVRAVHNSQVNSEIGHRQTGLPITLDGTQELHLDLFFPLAPSPDHVEISYTDAKGAHRVDLDTREALAGLHLGTGASVNAGASGLLSRERSE